MVFFSLDLKAQLPSGEDYMPENEEIESNALDDFNEHLQTHAININTGNWNELQQIPNITTIQINALIEHRNHYGYFKSLLELQQVKGFDIIDIQKIRLFITLNLPVKQVIKDLIRQPQIEWQCQVQTKLEKSEGYTNTSKTDQVFLGNRLKETSRLKIGFGQQLRLQVITKKDAGERFNQSSTGFSLQYLNKGLIQEVIAGNFQLQFGQGLCIGNTLAFGKSANVMGIMRAGKGLRHTGSVNNKEVLKGSACHLKLSPSLHVWVAISNKKTDAQTSIDSNGLVYISSLVSSNLYRNNKEIKSRNNLQRFDVILRSDYRFRQFQAGLTISGSRSRALRSIQMRDKIEQKQSKIGIDCQYAFRNILVFHETAMDFKMQQSAYIQGALISLDKYTDISVMYRHYSGKFNSDNTNALASGNGSNERGWLIGYQMRAAKKLQLNAYVDLFKHPEKTYKSDGPSNGKEALIQLNYVERNAYIFVLRYQLKENQFNSREPSGMRRLETHRQDKVRADLSYQINKNTSMTHRLEINRYQIGENTFSNGYLMYHNVSHRLNSRLRIQSRWTVFHVSDFNSRIYAYENDLSSVYAMKAWQDKGVAFYTILQYHVNKILQIKTKFASIRYSDIHESGSGADAISGQLFNEVKFEITLKI